MNRRIDAARQAGSQTAQNTRDLLSKYGLANSAFGARVLAEETGNINQQVANVPADVTQEILNQAPSVALGASGQGFGGLGAAGGLNINSKYRDSQSSYGVDLGELAMLAAL